MLSVRSVSISPRDSQQIADQSIQVGNKDKFKAAQDALEVELKAESMVRAVFHHYMLAIR